MLLSILPAALIRALDTLRENKRVEPRVMMLRKADAELNDSSHGRSNNSFNPSGNNSDVIVNLDAIHRYFPPG
jgi:hypothetical protein